MKYSQDKFSSSFWPSSVTLEPNLSIPDYKSGLQVLHDKLCQSVIENETIMNYLQKRIDTEKQCADLFIANLTPAMSSEPVESTMNASLKSSFDIVCQEHTDRAHGHQVRAKLLQRNVLSPLAQFTTDVMKRQLEHRYRQLNDAIEEFQHESQTALMTRSVYWSKCHFLEVNDPTFRPPVPPGYQEDGLQADGDAFVGGRQRSSSVASEWNVDQGGVRLGNYTVLPYREVARLVTRMEKMIDSVKKIGIITTRKYLGKDIYEWVRDYCVSPQQDVDSEAQEICQHLVALKFLKKTTKETTRFDLNGYYEVQHNVVERYLRKTRIRRSIDYGPMDVSNNDGLQSTTLEVPSSTNGNNVLNGFLDRINLLKKNTSSMDPSTKARMEMTDADNTYKAKIKSVDTLRRKLEENMFDYFDEMEELEKKRVEAVKQAFITLASVLNENSSISDDGYNRITLVQETLKPEQDIQYIVEQLKTGFYCPRPMLYENYYYGTAINQTFGVPLEEIAQIHGSFVPPLVNKGLRIIEAGFNLKRESEMSKAIEEVWTQILPIKELNKACEDVNGLAGSRLQETLERRDSSTIANLIRMYLLTLPECLLTFDLYEPVKILYVSQNNSESRLLSVSKLLATLPSPNYHTLKAFSHHLYKLLKNNTNETLLNDIIQSFSYVLMRPQVFSSVNMYDQHPKRLFRDLLTQYPVLFTKDINLAQKSSASRSAIVADTTTNNEPPPSVLRRTLKNIIRRHSNELVSHPTTSIPEESGETTTSSPIIPHPKITLFEDPEKSQPTPPRRQDNDDDKVDMKRLSNDLEMILHLEGGQEEDAVEIQEKEDIEKKVLSPKTPGRSRASTRGTLDNIELDPFFED